MLDRIALDQSLDREGYRKRLRKAQVELHRRARRLYEAQRLLVVVCEGWDAAGKGGAIRRTTAKLDPRAYQVFPIAAPTDEEKTHHYLWRFWRRLLPPREKQILIFDRSWYGRVLVERVEGFAAEVEWKRAYREINDFERQLIDGGVIVAKLFFHIGRDEQLRRFEARRETAHKSWKLTDEDWRNRDKWDDYEAATEEMLVKTSTRQAPWTIVEANDKRFARVKTLDTLIATIGDVEPAKS